MFDEPTFDKCGRTAAWLLEFFPPVPLDITVLFLARECDQSARKSLEIRDQGIFRGRMRRLLPSGLWTAIDARLFPHFRTMDRNFGIDLEAQSDLAALNVEHRDLKHALEAGGSSNDDRFLAFPGQDQHVEPPCL